ncbi:Alkaline-phosphatase-like, core domain,Alkaline phosphatase-like, alpha/beta/alpha,Alkaline [Cinara cedri]|uniref:Alkaline phosphatase n=1 Tax=Cinara cedri TaxID=506608 RepID=A0A5E4MFJ6_9HEMI|nr:Alkaline-phosphatase-like, core domain,Alkaline phosphatase-like, alpha/beta/alpha,Alkaline [Cinara cedri]
MRTSFAVCAVVLACGALQQVSAAVNAQESDSKYWLENGKRAVQEKSKMQLRIGKAKNLIIFLGDGMSLTTLTAARIYQGQLQNVSGESDHLSFEQFPFTGISKTYCVDSQVADSACTATAYLCGVKTNKATIGVTANVQLFDCPASVPQDRRSTSIMQWAQWAGKATGIVTTTRVTHASPAGAFAHTAHRDWESDADLKSDSDKTNVTQCEDIAKQLIDNDPGRNFKVIMGGGRNKFVMRGQNSTGERSDEDLIVKWKNDKQNRFAGKTAKYLTNKDELLNTDMSKVDFVLGLFHKNHMDYRLKSDIKKQPTLKEMTSKAIQLLQKEPAGFVLFVEGGLIDKAHHSTLAKIALDETVEFSKAVQEAATITNEEDTLIVVTSDHAHTMSMAGYPKRGRNILGTTNQVAMDNMTYTTLSYANGPKKSYQNDSSCHRINVTNDNFDNVDYQYPSLVDLDSETHGGDDVMVFARGPWAHLFTGNMEQNEIPLAMAMAAGISTEPPTSGSGGSKLVGQITLIATVLLGLRRFFW